MGQQVASKTFIVSTSFLGLYAQSSTNTVELQQKIKNEKFECLKFIQ